MENYTPTDIDAESLKVKLEAITLDEFLSNLQGDAKVHVESLVAQLEEARDPIEEKEGLSVMRPMRLPPLLKLLMKNKSFGSPLRIVWMLSMRSTT